MDTNRSTTPIREESGRVVSLAGREPVDVTLVLPCLNEADSVGDCVGTALRAMRSAGIAPEVIVVDNGSTDGSPDVAREHGARVIHERRRGYGSALRAGIEAARGEIVVMADADSTYALDRIPDLVARVRDGEADLVLGKRVVEGRESMPFLHRFVGTPMLTFLIRRVTGGRQVSDSQSGFRAFRKDAADELGLRSTGMEFASEMLIKAARVGWRIDEVPTEYRERVGESKLNTFADGWRHLRLIAMLAPDLLLVWPGMVAVLLGFGLGVWTLLDPTGLHIGSFRWQPVFFAPIAMVVGVQALLAGLVMAYASSVFTGTKERYVFVGDEPFLAWCVRGGWLAVLAGLLVDVALFGIWTWGGSVGARALPMAAMAQSLIIIGATVASFGVITRLLCSRVETSPGEDSIRGLAALLGRSARMDEPGVAVEVHRRGGSTG